MPYYNNYITSATLDNIRAKTVESIKTAYNHSKIFVEVEPTILELPIEGIDPIEIPNFEEQRTQQYSYEKIDVYSAAPEYDITATSAYPEVSHVSAYNEEDDVIELTDLATQECMIVATANGIIKQLIEDNKLLYNPQNLMFKWFVQTEEVTLTFDPDEDYPNVLDNLDLVTIQTIPASLNIYSTIATNLPQKIKKQNGEYFNLEKEVTITIPNDDVDVSKIVGINILGYNQYEQKTMNIKDFYFTNNNELVIKLQNIYESSAKEVTYDLTIQYFFN